MTFRATRRLRRSAATGALVVALGMALAGCGSAAAPTATAEPSTQAPSSPPVILPTPSANGFVDSVISTQSMGSAQLEVDLTSTVDGSTTSLHGEGISVLDPGWADLTWTTDGATTREMVNDQGIFVQTSPPDGRWTHIATKAPNPGATPTSASAAPLRDLETLAGVTIDGQEKIDGEPATRITGTLPVDDTELMSLGLSQEQIDAIGPLPAGAHVDVTVWLDSASHIIRVDRRLALGAGSTADVLSSTRLVDFGAMVDLTSPSSSLVDEAPEGQ
jgi:hypothetical protein